MECKRKLWGAKRNRRSSVFYFYSAQHEWRFEDCLVGFYI